MAAEGEGAQRVAVVDSRDPIPRLVKCGLLIKQSLARTAPTEDNNDMTYVTAFGRRLIASGFALTNTACL